MVDFLLIYWPLFALALLALITIGSLVIAVAIVLGREAVWVIGFRAYVIAAVIVSLACLGFVIVAFARAFY